MTAAPRWTEHIPGRSAPCPDAAGRFVVGVLPGEGIGPEVVGVALGVLDVLESAGLARFDVRGGGPIGFLGDARDGHLTGDVARFCARVFAAGGAVLAGPGGGRFVYDLRHRFDLFCKLSPVVPVPELAPSCRMRPEHLRGLDLLFVRENVGGVYAGRWIEEPADRERGRSGRVAHHAFSYTEDQVGRIVDVAARLAAARRGRLATVVKDAGIPAISALWRDLAHGAAARHGVQLDVLNVDLAAYRLVQEPQAFDVVVSSNLFGDILIDLAAVHCGARALGFSGNFGAVSTAVYQTNHGAAHDIAGTDRANPAGQILALSMMLRESFGLVRAAALVEEALRRTWRTGLRTADLVDTAQRPVGTRAFGDAVIASARELARDFAA